MVAFGYWMVAYRSYLIALGIGLVAFDGQFVALDHFLDNFIKKLGFNVAI